MKCVYLIISIFCCVTMMGCAKSAFDNAKSINTVKSYSDFIKKYPKSEFADTASELKESLIFQDSIKTNTVESFQVYLTEYPNGRYYSEVDSAYFNKIKQLKTIEAFETYLLTMRKGRYNSQIYPLLEDAYFIQCINGNDLQSCRAYLKVFSKGDHRFQVREKLSESEYQKALQAGSQEQYEAYLTEFPESKHRSKIESLLREKQKEIIWSSNHNIKPLIPTAHKYFETYQLRSCMPNDGHHVWVCHNAKNDRYEKHGHALFFLYKLSPNENGYAGGLKRGMRYSLESKEPKGKIVASKEVKFTHSGHSCEEVVCNPWGNHAKFRIRYEEGWHSLENPSFLNKDYSDLDPGYIVKLEDIMSDILPVKKGNRARDKVIYRRYPKNKDAFSDIAGSIATVYEAKLNFVPTQLAFELQSLEDVKPNPVSKVVGKKGKYESENDYRARTLKAQKEYNNQLRKIQSKIDRIEEKIKQFQNKDLTTKLKILNETVLNVLHNPVVNKTFYNAESGLFSVVITTSSKFDKELQLAVELIKKVGNSQAKAFDFQLQNAKPIVTLEVNGDSITAEKVVLVVDSKETKTKIVKNINIDLKTKL